MLPCMRKAQEASTYAKNYRQLSKAERRIMVFPRKKDTDWLSNAKWPAIKTHIQLTLSRHIQSRLHLCIRDVYAYTFISSYMEITINEQRGRKHEKKKGRMYGRVYRGEREGREDLHVL